MEQVTKEEKAGLEKVRIEALSHMRIILPSIKSLEEELEKLYEEQRFYNEQYKEADYALAETDGRLRKIAQGKRGAKPVKLNLEQIKRVAKELGVKL